MDGGRLAGWRSVYFWVLDFCVRRCFEIRFQLSRSSSICNRLAICNRCSSHRSGLRVLISLRSAILVRWNGVDGRLQSWDSCRCGLGCCSQCAPEAVSGLKASLTRGLDLGSHLGHDSFTVEVGGFLWQYFKFWWSFVKTLLIVINR